MGNEAINSNSVVPEYKQILTDEISISDTASAQLSSMLNGEEDDDILGVRIYVSGGGCSGMTYGMTFTDQQSAFDRIYQKEGLTIYIDAVAMNYLSGVEIDFVERPGGASFVFNNAFQATSSGGGCGGCGSSSASSG